MINRIKIEFASEKLVSEWTIGLYPSSRYYIYVKPTNRWYYKKIPANPNGLLKRKWLDIFYRNFIHCKTLPFHCLIVLVYPLVRDIQGDYKPFFFKASTGQTLFKPPYPCKIRFLLNDFKKGFPKNNNTANIEIIERKI